MKEVYESKIIVRDLNTFSQQMIEQLEKTPRNTGKSQHIISPQDIPFIDN